LKKKRPPLYNQKRSIDINSTPMDEMHNLPEFILNKMASSEEYAARVRVNKDPVIGTEAVKKYRPKAAGETVIEYPAEDVNLDDVPF
jgi:hypothetical protein